MAEAKSLSSPTSASASASAAIDFLTIARGLKQTKRTGWIMSNIPENNVESVADHSWRITLMAMIASSSSSSPSSSTEESSSGDVITYDTNKCIKMALVHDIAEATVGDITPHCNVSDEEKHKLELESIMKMKDALSKNGLSKLAGNTGLVAEEIVSLWKEYEEGKTNEAKLVKDCDKLEMILQALEYENEYNTNNDDNNSKGGDNNDDKKEQKEDDGDDEKKSPQPPNKRVKKEETSINLDQFFTSTSGKWRTSIGESWGKEIESRRKKIT